MVIAARPSPLVGLLINRVRTEQTTDHGVALDVKDIPWAGKVILNKDNIIYMKPGSAGGVETGMEFNVFRPGEELIDPDTGLSLGSEEKKIGVIQVTGDVPGAIYPGEVFKRSRLMRLKPI